MLSDREQIILCDVDGVVVQGMLAEWLRRYNNDWDDDLSVDEITEWSLLPFVKPECGKKIYSYLNDVDFYDNLYIDGECLWGVRKLQELPSTRVVFLSAGIAGALGKYKILNRHALISTEKDFICASDKSLVYGDAMIDDYEENIFSFQQRNPKGTGLLFDALYNRHVEMTRVRSWYGIVNFFNFTGKL